MKGGGGDSLLWAYYLATPLFVVLDFGFAMPIRAVGIESPGFRLAYYSGTFLVGWVMAARPPLAPWLAMGESAANLTLLMASVLVPVWSLQETLDAGAIAYLPERVVNLAVSGSVLEPLSPEEEEGLDPDGALPVQRLLTLLAATEAGERVEFEYLRDGAPWLVAVVLEGTGPFFRGGAGSLRLQRACHRAAG